jgi:SAM-dependent methyltransferase
MNLLELLTELEVDAPVATAASPLRLLAIGKYLGLRTGQSIIDYGCGRGEVLCLWARHLGISGVGIDLDAAYLADARERALRWRIASRVSFVQRDARQHHDPPGAFDVAVCLCATRCFGGLGPTLRHLGAVTKRGGALVISEPFYHSAEVPEALRAYEGDCHTEAGLFDIVRGAGLEVGYYGRASLDEWERYIFGGRKAEMGDFLRMAPGDEQEERRQRLRRWQDMYLRYRQEWQGMAFMTLHRV